MKYPIIRTAILLAFLAFMSHCQMKESVTEDEKEIEEIVSAMTLVQKARLVIGTGMYMDLPIPEEMMPQLEPMLRMFGWINEPESAEDTVYTNMVDRVRTYLPGTAGVTAEFPDLGITSQVLTDGPAGLRIQGHATAFPIATLLASSWDTELVNRVGKTMGSEALESGSDVVLAPGMNLQRDPLCGRNFEYYSEDPVVTGKMAAAMISGIQSSGVGTAPKHFAANNQETNRMSSNSILTARALRELYLKGFEIAVKEARPWTVMSSYNLINGVPASESAELLTAILRDDWGFDGYVMTDWMGGTDVVAQLKAGNDVIMPGRPELIGQVITAVEEGLLEEEILDRNIRRILGIMIKTPRYRGYEYSGPDLETNAKVARDAAAEGMVLLKNEESVLPLGPGIKNVAAFGNAAYEIIIGGTGSGDVNEAYSISLVEGLRNGGYDPDGSLEGTYRTYMEEARAKQGPPANPLAAMMGVQEPLPEMPVARSLADRMAAASDAALIVIGRNAGEGGDREPVEGDFYLTSVEKEMIRNVAEAFRNKNKPAVVILNIPGVIEVASWNKMPDAILCAWQPGQEAGNAIADVVSGKVNPSGKLAATFPLRYEECPTSGNFPGTVVGEHPGPEADAGPMSALFQPKPTEVIYQEDIYVGYRYYHTFNVPVAYEFGYGLSYTTFRYGELELDSEEFDGSLNCSIEITNTGDVPGKEAVQIYVSAPGKDMDKPVTELVAFGKTALLKPGESQKLEFGITTADIASFEASVSSWVAEAGEYELQAGASSAKIRDTAFFRIGEPMNAGTVSRSLLPHREIDRLYVPE